MLPALVRYAGTFRFTDTATMTRAHHAALAAVNDDDPDEAFGGTLRPRVIDGRALVIDFAIVWDAGPRFAAALLLETLARQACAGSVEAWRGSQLVDEFVAGPDADD